MTPTPPSTTSSSAGHSPEFRVIRKRNRVPLSCAPCRNRKLKCNRTHPCENCVKRGDAASCSYAQAGARKKNSPQQQTSPTSPDDMQNRIDRLEGLVLSLMTNGAQSAGPAAALAAISGESSGPSTGLSNELDFDEDGNGMADESDTEQVTKSFGVMKMDNNKSYYISEAHWASVLNDISEVRNFFSTHKQQFEEQAEKVKATQPQTDVPGSALLFGVMKPLSRAEILATLPSKYTTDLLVARYFNSYDPATHILHGPTFQSQYNKHWENPSKTEIVWIAMLFAMMRLAMLSYHREGDEPPEFRGKAMDMAGSFRNSVAQCLTLADYTKPHPYLIESLVFHLHGDFSQTREADVSVWVLTGVIARLAMRMGYHRDSKAFPNITPFQGEMRRRVWSFVRQADLLFSFQVGMPSMLRAADSDTDLPRNLYDDDFDEDCKELPQPRQVCEPTPISYLITKARLVYAFGRVNEHASAVHSTSYDKVMELDADLRHARDLIPDHLQLRPMEDCQLDPVNLIMSRFSVNTVYHKAQIVLHRPYLCRARESPRFTYSRRTCIDSAMEMLKVQTILHAETRHGRLRGRYNLVSSLSSTDFLLAATIATLDLYQSYQLQASGRSSGDTYTWGRERGDEMMAAIQRSKEIWVEMRDESMEAYKASNILAVMISKLHSTIPGLENGAGSTIFEPQDEKQNAAMTLGLLSSGMSPMNSGSTPFNDPMFKMSDSPMPTGMATSSAEMPSGPLSPFSSMFGQMPDMQVNLDWDAWDTYIQNPTLDTSNQFWPMMDPQRQPTPQTVGLSQPAVSSPLATARDPSLMNNLSRLPSNMFSPSSNSDNSALLFPSRNPLRRAASRFLSSPLPYTSRSISRSRCALPIQTGTSTLGLQTPYVSALQIRWNSSKDNAETPLPQESQTSEQPVEQEGQQALENQDAPKETREAQRKRQTRFQYLDQQTRLLEECDANPPSETVYVGNIFYDIAAEDLRKHFEAYGVVLKSMIVHDNRGLSKGFGYVQFNTVEEATNAIENQHLQLLEGRTVVVQFARSQIEHKPASGPPSNCLFIGNIPFELTDRDLQELIRDVHNIIDVRVPVDRRSGVPRGFAHVEFLDVESAARAKDILSRKAPYGRKLRVNFTDRRKVGIGMMNAEQGSSGEEGEGTE
ncbi:uncharacterized protein N7459_002241 [Penicillium hispanicum]|uniref:uncharacterized protein n=1 Tax=Penicillium hispanicum TaxID=1080232 RepID=UPI00253F7C8A|nr:uncharacterized protein N7459_002241 [Penicillium hispanicum]KAJ5591872.1 hypothetical protein N7459_002241 [Penicillium hispanicum]